MKDGTKLNRQERDLRSFLIQKHEPEFVNDWTGLKMEILWHEILIADLAANRVEAIDYLDLSLQEYQIDGDTSFFLKGIRNIIEALGGVTEIAKQTDTEPEALFEVLSSDNVPCIDTLNIIANALGCRLSIEPIAAASPNPEIKDKDHPIVQRAPTRVSLSGTTDS